MPKITQERVRVIVGNIGECAAHLPAPRGLDKNDMALMYDTLQKYVRTIAQIFPAGSTQFHCSMKMFDEIKRVCHVVSCLRLKYLMLEIRKTWDELVANDSAVSQYINMGRWSKPHGEAEAKLKEAMSRNDETKVKNHNECFKHIIVMDKLRDEMQKTEADCRVKIHKRRWFGRRKALALILSAASTVLFVNKWDDIVNSYLGKTVLVPVVEYFKQRANSESGLQGRRIVVSIGGRPATYELVRGEVTAKERIYRGEKDVEKVMIPRGAFCEIDLHTSNCVIRTTKELKDVVEIVNNGLQYKLDVR